MKSNTTQPTTITAIRVYRGKGCTTAFKNYQGDQIRQGYHRHKGLWQRQTLTLVDNIPVLNTGHYYNIISGLNGVFRRICPLQNQFPTSLEMHSGHGSVFIYRQNNATLHYYLQFCYIPGRHCTWWWAPNDPERQVEEFHVGYQWWVFWPKIY